MATHRYGCVFQLKFFCFVFKKVVVFLNQTGLSILVYLNASKKKRGGAIIYTRGSQPPGRVPVPGLETGSGGTKKNSILTSPVIVIAIIPV